MKGLVFFQKFGIVLVLVGLVVYFSIMSNAFLTPDNLFNVARQVSMLGIASVGMMFVILTAGIDLSVGSVMAFVGVVCAHLMVNVGMNPVLACVICVLMSAGIGFLQGVIITKILVPPIITTMGFMTLLSGLAFIISGGLPIFGFPRWFSTLGQGYVWVIPIPVIIMIGVFALGWFILNRTYFGRYFYAIGGNEEAAKLSGIKVHLTKQMVYMLSGTFASLAAIIMLSRLNSGQPTTGKGFEFECIIAVVLGGVSIMGGSGKIFGVVIGVLIMGVLSNGLILMNVNDYVQDVVQGIVLIAAVGFDCLSKARGDASLKEHIKKLRSGAADKQAQGG
jgi:ribose transport system permease protein